MEDQEIIEITQVKMTALQFVLSMRHSIPMSTEAACEMASNSEVRRWLDQSAVIINGKKPKAKDIIELPVTSLIFFPKSKATTRPDGRIIHSRKTTVI